MPYFKILFVFKQQCYHLFKVLCLQVFPTYFYMQCFFSFKNANFFTMFLILLISCNKQVLLRIFFFYICIRTVSKWEECDLELSKIGSRVQGNRRWQLVVLLEKELNHFSSSTVIFSKYIVLLYNHRKDVWYFYQKNCRRSTMML